MTDMLLAVERNDSRIYYNRIWPDTAPTLKRMGTKVVYAKRNNTVDHIVCEVRDCFRDDCGFPVDKNGERSNLCFDRRNVSDPEKEKEYKAMLFPPEVVDRINRTAADCKTD